MLQTIQFISMFDRLELEANNAQILSFYALRGRHMGVMASQLIDNWAVSSAACAV